MCECNCLRSWPSSSCMWRDQQITRIPLTIYKKQLQKGDSSMLARKVSGDELPSLVQNQPVYIHPGSVLYEKQPDWVIYHRVVITSKGSLRIRSEFL